MKQRKQNYQILIVLLLLAAMLIAMSHRASRGSAVSDVKEVSTESRASQGSAARAESAEGTGAVANTESRSLVLPIPQKGMLLQRSGYTTAYNPETRCPGWTAWVLTADHTTGPYKRQGISYHEDTDVPSPRATNSDYMRSGYDRGHMCPSGDNKWSREAQEDCFLFTNMCPQSHNLNGGDWNELEMKCRTWAKRYDAVYIVCGPLFREGAKRKTIGKNKVAVPDGFWKVVLRADNTAAIGFYYDNEDGHQPMSSYVRTVDEIEQLTGLDFFSQLDDKTEATVESHADLSDW